MTETKSTHYAWTVNGTAQMFFGDYAQHDAEQEAKHIGGTARAFPLFAGEPAPQPPVKAAQQVNTTIGYIPIDTYSDVLVRLIGVVSAYKTYTKRTSSLGRVPEDPFYTTRLGDMEQAVERFRSVLSQATAESSIAMPSRHPLTDDKVYEAIKGIDSLDALQVWRAAEAAHGIKGKK